eukprot:gene10649-biopygen7781
MVHIERRRGRKLEQSGEVANLRRRRRRSIYVYGALSSPPSRRRPRWSDSSGFTTRAVQAKQRAAEHARGAGKGEGVHSHHSNKLRKLYRCVQCNSASLDHGVDMWGEPGSRLIWGGGGTTRPGERQTQR